MPLPPEWVRQSLPFLEAAPDAMVVVEEGGRIVLANRQAEAVFGYSREELVGQPVDTLVPERFRPAHPEMRAAYFQDPHPRAMGAAGVELSGRRKDGTEFPAEISLSPIHVEGETFAIAATRDVSARRRIEARSRGLLDAAPDAMVIVDADGRIVLVNAQAEALFGYRRDDLIGEPLELLVPERYRPAHPAHRVAYFAHPRARPMGAGALDLHARRADGSEFPAEISLSPLETEEGLLVTAAIRDSTERRRAEEERARLAQAQEAIRARDEFLSVAAHELRTPMTSLQLDLEGVVRALARVDAAAAASEPVERARERVGRALRQLQRLAGLVDRLLDVSRIATGRLELARERMDLAETVAETVARFLEEARRAGCELTQEGQPSAPGSWDRFRVEQVVTNLISNAIKYGAGKPVRVSVTSDGARARLEVRDQGIGIAAEDRDRVFDRFERAVSSRHFGGLGLGLFISRQIVEAHGGEVRVESAPGRGATFTVELPLTAEEPRGP